MLHVVLVNPQIPNNTGAIGRLCINMGATLHLIKPLGFNIDEKSVRRAGLDYWKKLSPIVWEDWQSFYEALPDEARLFLATTKTDQNYFDVSYQVDDYLVFGSETQGLPQALLDEHKNECVTIPMTHEGRSLNLAMAVSIVAYEAVKQNFTTFKELM